MSLTDEDKQWITALMDTRLNATEERLVEKMRDMQTEILRGFGSWSEGQTVRVTKLESEHSILNDSSTRRIALLEQRMFEIEKRLLMEPPK